MTTAKSINHITTIHQVKRILTILVVLMVSITSCTTGPTTTVPPNKTILIRAKDVITNIPAAVEVKRPTVYKYGDTVWVHIPTMSVMNVTWQESTTGKFRLFVLEKSK